MFRGRVIAAALLVCCSLAVSQAGENWTGNFRLLGKVNAAAVSDNQIVLTAENREKARMTASKFITDLLAFGDGKALKEDGFFEIPGAGFRYVGVNGEKVVIFFAPTLPALRKVVAAARPSPAFENVKQREYPRWFDRFDNEAVNVGVLGWGVLPQDYRHGINWMKQSRFGILGENNNPNMQLSPGVWDYTVANFYRKLAAENGTGYQTYTPWNFPDFPAFLWEYFPLPWYRPEPGSVVHPSLANLRLNSCNRYEPAAASSRPLSAMYREQARRFAQNPDFLFHFGIVEVGSHFVLNSLGYAGNPEAVAAWRNHLSNAVNGDLAVAGLLMHNDRNAYRSWQEVEFPSMLNVINRSTDFLDLRGEWEMYYDPAKRNRPPGDARWRKIDCNDSILAMYQDAPGRLWLRRTFELPAARHYSHLHISRNGWHARKNPLFQVWINGGELKDLTRERFMTSDNDQALETGKTLKSGLNTILIDAKLQAIPHYILLNNEPRFTYPGEDEYRNRLYFEMTEFTANYRMEGIGNILRAIRSGDPSGRPIQVMHANDLLDKIQPLLRRYGAYAHDTGQTGHCWAPWPTRYTATHGLPISSEPGGPPRNAAQMRQMATLYLMTGNDGVNLLFDPSQYSQGEIGEWMQKNREILNAIGKVEMPHGDVGVLRSVRNSARLHSDPVWTFDPSRGALQAAGRTCNLVTLNDFLKKDVPFSVVIDAGTEILTAAEVEAILDFVHRGGTFIAMQHTGTHSEKRAFAWPLETLSGLKVVNKGSGVGGRIRFTDTQSIWPALRGRELPGWGQILDWENLAAPDQALHLKKNAPDIEVIAEWVGRTPAEGNIALAARRIGRGRLLVLGSSFMRRERDIGGSFSTEAGMYPYLSDLLDSLGVPRSSCGHNTPGMQNVFAEQWRSKNGLYDLYMVAHIHNQGNGVKADPGFPVAERPAFLKEFSAPGHPDVPYTYRDGILSLSGIALEPMGVRIYAAPRRDAAEAVFFWLKTLHKRWYTLDPLPAETGNDIADDGRFLSLNDGWEVVEAAPDPAGLTGKRRTLATFLELGLPDEAVVRFRRTFRVPAQWRQQRLELGLASQYWFWGVVPNGRLLVNGREFRKFTPSPNGGFAADLPYAPEYTLELEIDGRLVAGMRRSRPSGVTGLFYVRQIPVSTRQIPLKDWKKTDGINGFVAVRSGERHSFIYLEREFETPPGKWQSVYLESPEPLGWLCLNGTWIAPPGHLRRLNISNLLNRNGKPNVLRWCPGLIKETPGLRRVLTQHIPEPVLCCY